MSENCEHVEQATGTPAMPRTRNCEQCQAIGASWNELRVCLTCGHVGCCEDSPHAHALRHFQATGHPVIVPLARAETWGWCYVHRRYFDPMPPLPFKQRTAIGRWVGRLRRRST